MDPLVIVNPVSGRGRAAKALPAVRARLDALGVEAEIRVSTGPDDPARWAAAAAAAGRPVVAFGGDGLVSAVLNATANKVPMGVLPSGTGNDFARSVGIPLDPVSACDLLANPTVRAFDCGRIELGSHTHRFGCIASVGFDSEVNRRANEITWASGTPVYVLAVLETILRWRPATFRITVDGEQHETRGWFTAVGNGISYGGGMRICPEADLHDGLLEVTVLGDAGKVEFLRAFPRVFKGTHLDHPKVTSLRGRRVEVEADRPFRCFTDGEDTCAAPVAIEAEPGALQVMVPLG